tara:strand:+ start:2700 stop:3428 length:729 start_codon:yes stop_codon:yes gene_type:complete
LIAISYGITNLAFNWAIAEGNVMRVVFLFYLMPIWAQIFAIFLIKEKLTIISFIGISTATFGAFLILIYNQINIKEFSPEIFFSISKEDFLAIVGGIFFGLGNVLVRKAIKIKSLLKTFAIFYGTFFVAAVFLLVNLIYPVLGKSTILDAVIMQSFTDIKFLLIFSSFVVGLGLANFLLQLGASKLPVFITSTLLMFEILVALVSTTILQEAPLRINEFIGGGLILIAAFLMITNTWKISKN